MVGKIFKYCSINKLVIKQNDDVFEIIEPNSGEKLVETIFYTFAQDWVDGFLFAFEAIANRKAFKNEDKSFAFLLGSMRAETLFRQTSEELILLRNSLMVPTT